MNKRFVIFGIVIILIAVGLSGCFQETMVDYKKEWFYGTWENNLEGITITFYSNGTFIVTNPIESYVGFWELKRDPWQIIILNWEGGKGNYMPLFQNNRTKLTLELKSGESGFFVSIDIIKST